MRFRKWPRLTAYEETSCKRAAFLTKQRREREALPLFADMIAAGQHSVDEEMARRAEWWPGQQQDRRDERALVWRKARARLFALPADRRRAIRALWRECPYPADPHSFADFLHQIEVGKLDIARPGWRFHARAKPRVTATPSTFGEAFRQIGRRKVNPSGVPSDADTLLFCGNLGKGILFLDRLVDPGGGLGIAFDVRGVCSNDDLALIERLALAAEDRPVTVRLIERAIERNADGVPVEPHRLLILACSATKRRDPGWIDAIDRYDGPLWQTVRAVRPNRMQVKVAVLSARYGFLDSRSPVEDYDARLTPDLAQRMIAGGMNTRWPRPPSARKPDTYGDSPGCQIASLSNHGTRPFTDVALAGGHLYITVLRAFLAGFRDLRCVAPDARITEINAPIGIMRQQVRGWLEESWP
ncbi:MAG: hypothetical protein J0I69_05175 [Altererythrobacter sp.]|nr:hypothetical protein [Altererythrobacter sp.]OJU59442.1 MAG: hypothetical protein BGO08_03705 [Altererythrobacter sp. 66-12]